MADVSKALNVVRKLNPLGLYSRAAEEAAKLPQAKGTGEQMRKMLLNQGAKPEELKWTGFDDWIKNKKSVTRDEITDFLNKNQVQISETVRGADPALAAKVAARNERLAAVNKELDDIVARETEAGRTPAEHPRWKELEKEYYSIVDTPFPEPLDPKFSEYALPGGKNYREVIIQDPEKSGLANRVRQKYEPEINPLIAAREALRPEYMRLYKEGPDSEFYKVKDQFSDLTQQAGRLEGRMQAEIKDLPTYRSSHWDEPNPLAHVRMSDRVDPEGRRVLHLEELQSDWGQEGKRKGFKASPEDLTAWNDQWMSASDERNRANAALQNFLAEYPNPTIGRSARDYEEQLAARMARVSADPRHKELTDALHAANQRMQAVREAAPSTLSGVPRAPYVESTPGWTNVALRRALVEGARGDYDAIAWTPGKMQAARYPEGGAAREAGMVGYYDKILPTQVQKVLKDINETPQFGQIPVSGASEPAATLPSFNLTPEMREKIKEGLPLFTMMPAAVGLGASQMQDGQNPAVEGEGFAGGGHVGEALRLIQDQYPTHYLPNVGRQVMADGGEPEDYISAQARRRATLENLGAFEDTPPMDPATMGQNWANAVQRFRDKPLREGEAVARPLERGMRDVIGGAIAGDGGTTRGQFARALVGSTGLPETGMGFGAADFSPLGFPLAAGDVADALRNRDYLSASLAAAGPATYLARGPIGSAAKWTYQNAIRPAYDAGRRAVDVAGDVLGRVPAPVAAGAAGAAAMTPEEAEAAKLRVPAGVTQILKGTPENELLNARAGLSRVVSPFSEDPEAVKRALEIAATYRVPQGAEFGSGSFFRKKPSMGVYDVQPDIAPLPGATPRAPRPLTWEEFGKEAQGGTLINVGGDRLNLGVLRDINNDKRMAWEVPLHAGPKYMLEPNPGLVWANAPGHTTSFNNIIENAAKKGPVYGVYAPMGPTAVDSSVGMFNAVMSQIPPAKITRAAAKEFDDMVRSGVFTQKVTDRPRTAELMQEIWPGLSKLKDQSAVLDLADKLTGTQRSDLIKAMEAAAWRKKGFPEVGVTRVAVTDPALLSTPTNTIGHRVVRFDTEGKVSPTRIFGHQTYPTESLGQYVADLPLVQTQYGMPTAMEKLLSKPTKSGEIMHPYSLDPMGRSSARKMFTEQKQLQPVDDRLIESIMMGLERQKQYGFKRGGDVSHHAMMIATQLGSSPRATV